MQEFYGYTRVSTVKQGEHGVSLLEQRDAIERYAARNGLFISTWFEEQVTAAKSGRKLFSQMVKLLREGKATGAIIHKIDRGARNFRDWADIQDLLDEGVVIHFVNEALDLGSRGGRLSADIQAVVAADFIRNLRQEVRKGFYGRLKQGLYPMPAVIGYLNLGRGKPKLPDPDRAPLIRKTFDLYATGEYGVKSLAIEMYERGLRSQKGRKVTHQGMSRILNNSFYAGVISLHNGQTFEGVHEPLISIDLFRRVQAILSGKTAKRVSIHDLTYRRLVHCAVCNNCVIGETQKGRIYYRCHTDGCPSNTVREDAVEEAVLRAFAPLQFDAKDFQKLLDELNRQHDLYQSLNQNKLDDLKLALANLAARQNRLLDAYLDGTFDKQAVDEQKKALMLERKGLEQKIAEIEASEDKGLLKLLHLLELAKGAYLSYKKAIKEEKRYMVKELTSNCILSDKKPMVELRKPLQVIAESSHFPYGDPCRNVARLAKELIRLTALL